MQWFSVTLAVSTFIPLVAASCTNSYTVVSGDSCSLIAQKNSVSNHQLLQLNPSLNCASLFVGQQLCVIDSTYNCQPVYTVVSGDSCSAIATSQQTTVSTLTANNPEIGSNCALQVGDVLCVATSVIGVTSSTPTCSSTYTVKSGDSCDAIASAQSISSYQLSYLNPFLSCSTLSIGQVLCITAPSYTCQPTYTVASGDSCFAIAQSHSITTDQILADNPQLGPSCPLSVGSSLCVSPTTPAPCSRFTTVQPGETCNDIGARTGASLFWILHLNPQLSADCSNLVSGAAVCVDAPTVDCSSVYQVKGTEGGCAGVASVLSINPQTIFDLNPNVNSGCTNLQVKEMLCTTSRTGTPPSTACTKDYTVVVGDTCSIIASRNSLTTAQLTALNPSLSCSALLPGDTLCSFSPSLSICPKLVIVAGGDTCFSLAQNVSMALAEWQSINAGLNCNPLQAGTIVCSSEGNATLPQAPSGSNPTSLPLCGTYDKTVYCCTQFSVSAPLFDSPLCIRANGCQDNCIGDAGVTQPTTSPTPTFTLTPTLYPTPPPPANQCASCTSSQCCALTGLCVDDLSSWYCKSENGCTVNCDQGVPAGHFDILDQQTFDLVDFTFPPGDYSATGGNPCGICDATTAGIPSASGQYCCSTDVQCLPQDFPQCAVFAGCLFNCIDYVLNDPVSCEMLGQCSASTTTVLQPFATSP